MGTIVLSIPVNPVQRSDSRPLDVPLAQQMRTTEFQRDEFQRDEFRRDNFQRDVFQRDDIGQWSIDRRRERELEA